MTHDVRSAAMMMLPLDERSPHAVLARRELVLVAVILVAFTRLVEPADAFLISGLLPVVMLLAGVGVLGSERNRRPFENLLVPAVLTGGAGAAIHLVSPGLPMVPALAVFALLLDRVLALEIRLLAQHTSPTESDRMRVLLASVVSAFIAFAGIATLVPGGLAGGGASSGGGGTLTLGWLLVLTIDVAIVALLLGYRLSVLRYGSAGDAARSALTYALVVAVAAGAIRAIGLPLVIGPAILALVFYLWDALHGTAPARRRQPRFLLELLVLVLLGAVVVAWNLQIAG
jgi:hypothetical protein